MAMHTPQDTPHSLPAGYPRAVLFDLLTALPWLQSFTTFGSKA
jgi:hypothetical protein